MHACGKSVIGRLLLLKNNVFFSHFPIFFKLSSISMNYLPVNMGGEQEWATQPKGMAVTGAVDMAGRASRSGTGDQAGLRHSQSKQSAGVGGDSHQAEEKQQKEKHREGDRVRAQLLSGWSGGGGWESYPEHHRIQTLRHFFLLTAGRAVEGGGEVTGPGRRRCFSGTPALGDALEGHHCAQRDFRSVQPAFKSRLCHSLAVELERAEGCWAQCSAYWLHVNFH